MISKISISPIRLLGLGKRFVHYTSVGVSTYLFDLFLIYCFKTFLGFPDALAIGLGFLIAVSINFLISYHWVFRGTKQTKLTGYLYFLGLATIGLGVIVSCTLFFETWLETSVYLARTLVAGIVGLVNFFINTFFNFKMPH